MPKSAILIPAYNCSKQIVRVLRELDETPGLLSRIEKVLVLDNRSTDDTFLVCQNLSQKLNGSGKFTIAQNFKNLGLGGSQKEGFKWARQAGFDFLIVLHGDNQATTRECLNFLDQIESDTSVDAILGSRFSFRSKRVGYSRLRQFGNVGLNVVYSILTLRWIVDLGSGLNAFRVSSVDPQALDRCSNQFTFNMDLLLYLVESNSKIKYIPITWTELDQVSNAKTFRVGWITLKTVLRWRFKNLF